MSSEIYIKYLNLLYIRLKGMSMIKIIFNLILDIIADVIANSLTKGKNLSNFWKK